MAVGAFSELGAPGRTARIALRAMLAQGPRGSSEQPDDIAVRVDVDSLGAGHLWEARHCQDVARVGDHEARSGREGDVADRHREPSRPARTLRVVAEGILRLGDA